MYAPLVFLWGSLFTANSLLKKTWDETAILDYEMVPRLFMKILISPEVHRLETWKFCRYSVCSKGIKIISNLA